MIQCVAGLVVIVVACWNIWTTTILVLDLGPREDTENEIFAREWPPFFYEFVKSNYRLGDVGYITARTLRGERPTIEDQARWVNFQYAAIPLNVVYDKLDVPFLIADFVLSGRPEQLPEGFDTIYDSGKGLLLLKRSSKK